MRKIELKKLGEEFHDLVALRERLGEKEAAIALANYLDKHGQILFYKDVLVQILLNPNPGKSFTTQEVRTRNKLLDKVEESEEVLLLEEVEFNSLRGIIEGYDGWPSASRNVVKFISDIVEAPVVEVTEVKS